MICCTFIGFCKNRPLDSKLVNIALLILTVESQVSALSHFEGLVDDLQAESLAKCLKLDTTVAELLVFASKFLVNDPSVS